jgi:hypothetical protein
MTEEEYIKNYEAKSSTISDDLNLPVTGVFYNWSKPHTVINSISYTEGLKIINKIFTEKKYLHNKFLRISIESIELKELYVYLKNLGNIILSNVFDLELSDDESTLLIQDYEENYLLHVSYMESHFKISVQFNIFTQNFFDSEKAIEKIKNVFKKVLFVDSNEMISLHYYYLNKEGMPNYHVINERVENVVKKENYPFIENIEKFTKDYIKSSATLLFLLGPPGTGKTRYIRYLLSQIKSYYDNQNSDVYFTADKNVVEHGRIFTDMFIEDAKIMVLEDFDFHLDSRKSGNTVMYHLLGISDGLVQSANRKIIISSNLSGLTNIDEAIYRHGRCFDIVNFRKLTHKESSSFFEKNNNKSLIDKLEQKEYSLADLYYILNNIEEKELFFKNKITTGF